MGRADCNAAVLGYLRGNEADAANVEGRGAPWKSQVPTIDSSAQYHHPEASPAAPHLHQLDHKRIGNG